MTRGARHSGPTDSRRSLRGTPRRERMRARESRSSRAQRRVRSRRQVGCRVGLWESTSQPARTMRRKRDPPRPGNPDNVIRRAGQPARRSAELGIAEPGGAGPSSKESTMGLRGRLAPVEPRVPDATQGDTAWPGRCSARTWAANTAARDPEGGTASRGPLDRVIVRIGAGWWSTQAFAAPAPARRARSRRRAGRDRAVRFGPALSAGPSAARRPAGSSRR